MEKKKMKRGILNFRFPRLPLQQHPMWVRPQLTVLIFTFGLSRLLRTLSHRRAPVLGVFLGAASPSSSRPLLA